MELINMKKEFTAPEIEVIRFDHYEDILTCSGEYNPCDPGHYEPGHGPGPIGPGGPGHGHGPIGPGSHHP